MFTQRSGFDWPAGVLSFLLALALLASCGPLAHGQSSKDDDEPTTLDVTAYVPNYITPGQTETATIEVANALGTPATNVVVRVGFSNIVTIDGQGCKADGCYVIYEKESLTQTDDRWVIEMQLESAKGLTNERSQTLTVCVSAENVTEDCQQTSQIVVAPLPTPQLQVGILLTSHPTQTVKVGETVSGWVVVYNRGNLPSTIGVLYLQRSTDRITLTEGNGWRFATDGMNQILFRIVDVPVPAQKLNKPGELRIPFSFQIEAGAGTGDANKRISVNAVFQDNASPLIISSYATLVVTQ